MKLSIFLFGFLLGGVFLLFSLENFSGPSSPFAKNYCGNDYFFVVSTENSKDDCDDKYVTVTAPNIVQAGEERDKILEETFPECDYQIKSLEKL